jgi:hypothetical protein
MKSSDVAKLLGISAFKLENLRNNLLRIMLPSSGKVVLVKYSEEYVRELKKFATEGNFTINPPTAKAFQETRKALTIVETFRQECAATLISCPKIDGMIVTKSIATIFGVDVKTVNNWHNDGLLAHHAIPPHVSHTKVTVYGSTLEEIQAAFRILS